MSFAPGVLLAQVTPDDVSAGTVFSASYQTEITKIIVTNVTVSATQYTLYHDDEGDTSGTAIFTNATKLIAGPQLPGNNTHMYTAEGPGEGIPLSRNGRIGLKAETTSAVTLSLYGVPSSAR